MTFLAGAFLAFVPLAVVFATVPLAGAFFPGVCLAAWLAPFLAETFFATARDAMALPATAPFGVFFFFFVPAFMADDALERRTLPPAAMHAFWGHRPYPSRTLAG